jgi:hypothetical protein
MSLFWMPVDGHAKARCGPWNQKWSIFWKLVLKEGSILKQVKMNSCWVHTISMEAVWTVLKWNGCTATTLWTDSSHVQTLEGLF